MRYSVQRPKKLNKTKVIQMRALWSSMGYSISDLSKMFHVSRNMAWKVVKGMNWKNTLYPDYYYARQIAGRYLRMNNRHEV